MEITGAGELRRVAANLRKEHARRQARINAKVQQKVRPLDRAIREAIPGRMPNRYAAVLAGSLKVLLRAKPAGVHLRIYAMGVKSQRDVNARNLGSLRHKLFGDRNHWYDQAIRPGFVTDPVRVMADDIYRGLNEVAEDIRQSIERG